MEPTGMDTLRTQSPDGLCQKTRRQLFSTFAESGLGNLQNLYVCQPPFILESSRHLSVHTNLSPQPNRRRGTQRSSLPFGIFALVLGPLAHMPHIH